MRAIVGGYTPPKKTRTNLPLPVVGYESATISLARPRADALTPREQSGAEGSRTLDLLNAIQALSQLSYGPTRREESERRRAYSPMLAAGQPNFGRPAGGTSAPARYHSRPPASLVDSAPAQCDRPDGEPQKDIDLSGRINVTIRPTIDLHRQPTLKGDAKCPSTSSSSLLLSRSASRLGYRDPTA